MELPQILVALMSVVAVGAYGYRFFATVWTAVEIHRNRYFSEDERHNARLEALNAGAGLGVNITLVVLLILGGFWA